jgi:hypothetical protein
MNMVRILRTSTTQQGTLGVMVLPGGWTCRTMELPWRENRTNISCIPAGEYDCVAVPSVKYGRVYYVQDVSGRTGILIHSGNLAGDVEQGWLTHSHGCILPGKYDGHLGNQLAVLVSRPTVTEIMMRMQGDPFRLRVEEMYR